jgi:hypothetical protein
MQERRPLAVGDVIHGFAQGGFGRDHYDCTRIEAAGPDWIVARDKDGDLSFAAGERSLRHLMMVRDTDRCPEEECPVGRPATGLTVPGGCRC